MEAQRLVLLVQPVSRQLVCEGGLVPRQLLVRRRLPVLQQLSVKQSLVTGATDRSRRRPGESVPAVTAEAPRADLAVAEAMDAAPAGVAPVAHPARV